jgi:ferrochelatase
MAYGTPRNPGEVEAFYTDIRGGRLPSPQLLANLQARYEAVGGRTPLLEITRRQASALEQALGPGYRVFIGMKHWHPYIHQTAAEMEAAGVEEGVALALAPHYSTLSVGAYVQAVREAGSGIRWRFVESWHLQPAFVEAVAERVRAASQGFDPDVVVFTAHSLPKRILDTGDPYADQLTATAEAVATRLNQPDWRFSFQSAGATPEPWLGPDILQTIDQLAGEGVRRALVAPIGFISDHLEILYDLDIQARKRADEHGLELRRTESLNADPKLIDALKAAVLGAA